MKLTSAMLLILLLSTCSDSTRELGSNYFLRIEGLGTNEILNRLPGIDGIPPDVISYGWDEKFIIAEQQPKEFDDALHEKEDEYRSGRKEHYFWIIQKDSSRVIGPLSCDEFEISKRDYAISQNLELNPIN